MTTSKLEKYQTVKSELESEISTKILNGQRITREEFAIAQSAGFYDQRLSFETLDATWYEDDVRQGWLCIDHKTGKIRKQYSRGKKLPDGTVTRNMCLFGIHRENVKPDYLRPEQKKFW